MGLSATSSIFSLFHRIGSGEWYTQEMHDAFDSTFNSYYAGPGYDTSSTVSFAGFYIVGTALITCCNAKKERILAKFDIEGKGFSIGYSVSAHKLTGNINGEGCPLAYSGWFWNTGISLGSWGLDFEKGLSDDKKIYDPSLVDGYGGSWGLGFNVSSFTYYKLVGSTRIGCCDD